MHSVWSKIDGILVVNLDTCTERMDVFRERNSAVLPMEKVHRLSAVYGRSLSSFGKAPWFTERTQERAGYWGGAAGCALSHRNAIAHAQREGWKNVLILEDDVEIKDCADGFSLLEKAVDTISGPYMLYAGYSRPTPYGRKVGSCAEYGLWQTEGVLSTFGYLVSQELYDPLLAEMPTEDTVWEWLARHRAIDTFYRDRVANMSGVKIYCIQPDIIEHIDGDSCIGSVTRTDLYSRTQEPYSYCTLAGVLHVLSAPLRRLKLKLNSIRTYRRALHGGFPGFRKKRKK
ncbi:MAG: hypothetical protein IKZ13_03080 [Akkermansia sp.]|nr:hypothetical protein [Akkermansia sp.]